MKELSDGGDPAVWYPWYFLRVFKNGVSDSRIYLILIDGKLVKLSVSAIGGMP